MMIVRLSGHPLVQDSLTHPLESIFILTVLVLQVIDLGLECTSGESRAAHEGGGRAPLGAPYLVGTPEVHRRTPCTHIYLRTLKLPEHNIDREFRRQKPP